MQAFVDFVRSSDLMLGRGLYSDYALFQPTKKNGVYLHHYNFLCPARAVYPKSTDVCSVDRIVRGAFHRQLVPVYRYDNERIAFQNGVYCISDHSFASHIDVDCDVVCRQLLPFSYEDTWRTPLFDHALQASTQPQVYRLLGDCMLVRPYKTTLLIGGDEACRREILNAMYSTFHAGDCDFISVNKDKGLPMCEQKPAFVAINGFEQHKIPDAVLRYANIGSGTALPMEYNADLVNVLHLRRIRPTLYSAMCREVPALICKCLASAVDLEGNLMC